MITFMHLKLGTGRVTVAIRPNGERDTTTAADIALAFCSPKDHFERCKGRLIAQGRLEKGKDYYRVKIYPLDSGFGGLKQQVIDALPVAVAQTRNVPSWVDQVSIPKPVYVPEAAERAELSYRRGIHQAVAMAARELEKIGTIAEARSFLSALAIKLRAIRSEMGACKKEHPLALHEAMAAVTGRVLT